MIAYTSGPQIARVRERIADLTTAVGLTAATYNVSLTTGTSGAYDKMRRPEAAIIQVKVASVNVTRVASATPTVAAGTDVGFTFQPGDVIIILGYENISNFKAINTVASSGAVLEVEYDYA